MKAVNVPLRPELIKILEMLAKKHNVSRSKVVRILLTLGLNDKTFVQRAMELL